MHIQTLVAFRDELTKIAQEGRLQRAKRKAGVAAEFASPPAEGLAAGLIAKGVGVKDPRKLLAAAGAGALHGVIRKTKKYAG